MHVRRTQKSHIYEEKKERDERTICKLFTFQPIIIIYLS